MIPGPVFPGSAVAHRAQPSEMRPLAPAPMGIRARLRHRRALAEQDRVGAHRAELHCIRSLLDDAANTVRNGWVQHEWFVYRDAAGRRRPIRAHNVRLLDDHPVAGACVVGAIIHAGGGRASAGSQLVQRALDVTWHALYRDVDAPVAWCPAPQMRAAQVRDLATWNDRTGRTSQDVIALLSRADHTAANCLRRLPG
jgi:hypothetical protein